MTEENLIGVTMIVALGIAAQWLAWRFHLPSILLLLLFGFLAGPVTGLVSPDDLFGELLQPLVSISVAIILFEGSLNLRFNELRENGKIIGNLISTGALTTWACTTAAAYGILGLDFEIALLLGAILIVTGPTVVLPMLRHIRPSGRVGSILKWEGIAIDPIGALLAVLVFQLIISQAFHKAAVLIFAGLLETVVIGLLLGALGAELIILFMKRYWVPDFLQNALALMTVVVIFALSKIVANEPTGFLSVTLLGIFLANQKSVAIQHIIEFKENLRVLILSGLFIVLAARLPLSDLNYIQGKSFLFLMILMLAVRPLAVCLSTWRSGLSWEEKIFIAWLAPRGVVAAAVSALFALQLTGAGYAQAEGLVAITFFVIIGTVLIYGITAAPLAYRLKVANPTSQGVLLVGAHDWAREIAKTLQKENFKVVLIDTNQANVAAGRMAGLKTCQGNVLAEQVFDTIDLDGIGRLLAVTPNDEANSLAVLHFREVFDRSQLYQLPIKNEVEQPTKKKSVSHLRGRFLFAPGINYNHLSEFLEQGGVVKTIKLTPEFDYNALRNFYQNKFIPLFLVNEKRDLQIITTESAFSPKPGQTLISFVMPPSNFPEK